jgi:hypothetical protein
MIAIARSGNSTTSSSTSTSSQPDYIALSEETPDLFYTLDTVGNGTAAPELAFSLECPSQIEDMLVIVRRLRQIRLQNMTASGEIAEFTMPVDEEDDTTVHSSDQITKSRSNNHVFRNARDLYAEFE